MSKSKKTLTPEQVKSREANKAFWALPVEERQAEFVRRFNARFNANVQSATEATAILRGAFKDAFAENARK